MIRHCYPQMSYLLLSTERKLTVPFLFHVMTYVFLSPFH